MTMTDRAVSLLTTVVVIPTAARCAAWRCASDAVARNGRAARFGTFNTTIRAALARARAAAQRGGDGVDLVASSEDRDQCGVLADERHFLIDEVAENLPIVLAA